MVKVRLVYVVTEEVLIEISRSKQCGRESSVSIWLRWCIKFDAVTALFTIELVDASVGFNARLDRRRIQFNPSIAASLCSLT